MVPEKLTVTLLVEGVDGGLRHQIHVEVTAEFRGGCRVQGTVAEMDRQFEGHGDSQLTAVLDLLQNVNRSMSYVPAYKKIEKG